MISCLVFKSLSHFEFMFVYGVKECFNVSDLYVADQISQNHLLKRFTFLHCVCLPPLLKINRPSVWGIISVLSFLFLCSMSAFAAIPHSVVTAVCSIA